MAAGAALYVSGVADSLHSGIDQARSSLQDEGGVEKLNQLVEFSKKL